MSNEYFFIRQDKTIVKINSLEQINLITNKNIKDNGQITISQKDIDHLKSSFGKIKLVSYINNHNSNISLNAIPHPQVILPKKDIMLTHVEGINSVLVSGSNNINSYLKVFISVDKGLSWNSFNNGWEELNIRNNDEIRQKGMNLETINNLNQNDWDLLLDNSREIRFGYYLEQTEFNNYPQTSNISLNVDLYGNFKAAVHEQDYDYQFTYEDKIELQLLRPGNYIINY